MQRPESDSSPISVPGQVPVYPRTRPGETDIEKRAMISNRRDLEAIGLERIGHLQLQADFPHYILHHLGDTAPALDAFAIGGAVMSVGKTVRTLDQRIYSYQKGSSTKRTRRNSTH